MFKATSTHHPQHRGIRASATDRGLWVGDSSVTCERVSSIYVWRDGDNYIEYGWYEAPAPTGNAPRGPCGDTDPDPGKPERMTYYYYLGQKKCLEFDHKITDAPSWHTFRIDNADKNGVFGLYFDGSLVWATEDMAGFTTGNLFVGSERTGNDSAYAHFHDMWYQDGTGWHLWDESCLSSCGISFGDEDTDTKWKAVRVGGSDYEFKVVSEGGSIPDET